MSKNEMGTFYSIKDILKRKKLIIPSDHRNISKEYPTLLIAPKRKKSQSKIHPCITVLSF